MFTLITLLTSVLFGGGEPVALMQRLGIDLRRGTVNSPRSLFWERNHLDRRAEVRKSKNGRTYVSIGKNATVWWSISKKGVKNRGKVIGITIERATGKKGGWRICLHKQKVVLSEKHRKFVFCNYWRHYWCSQEMLQAGLWANLDEKSKAAPIPRYILEDYDFQSGLRMLGYEVQPKRTPFNEEDPY